MQCPPAVQRTCHRCLAAPRSLGWRWGWCQMLSRPPRCDPLCAPLPRRSVQANARLDVLSPVLLRYAQDPQAADAAADQVPPNKAGSGSSAAPAEAASDKQQQQQQAEAVVQTGAAAQARLLPADLPDAFRQLLHQSVAFMQEQSSIGSEALVGLLWMFLYRPRAPLPPARV